ncbi:PD-(D/E)XK nuclease family transposase, partial [Treponema primitia]|uniref:PD-(D/E)XK nuclease family transposase n=1 Tax=Treponema primitia TaxID=88058 RepID=UPI0002555459
KRGEQYKQIRRVYQIFFLNFVLFPGSDKVPRRYFMQEEDEHDRLSDVVCSIFYELPKLDKLVQDCLSGKQ